MVGCICLIGYILSISRSYSQNWHMIQNKPLPNLESTQALRSLRPSPPPSATADRSFHLYHSLQDRKILQRIFDRIDSKHDNKIDKEELEQTLIALGYEPVKVTICWIAMPKEQLKLTGTIFQINQYGISEVEQMIWEVDEDCDGCVSWVEFQLMFDRARNDRTGHEPKKLFNLFQYMCLDRDGDGSITSEECMEMIMHRFGR
jgi:Ca2+-binding EF-hand superfamily protein